jgi:hypothetical protein
MERPTGVTILAVLGFLLAAVSLLAACAMFLMGAAGLAGLAGGRGIGGPLAALGAFAGVACLIFAALYVISSVGLLKLRGWGRLLTIVLVALSIVFGITGLFRAMAPMHAGMIIWELIILAVEVWIIAYLFKPHVKAAFGQTA